MEINIAKRLQGTGEYYFSGKLKEIAALNRQGAAIINLGIGSPDLPPHPEVIRILQEESAKPSAHAYQGYRGADVLRLAIAQWYHRWLGVQLDPATEILPLIGSKEGIMHICMTYLGEGDRALVPDPGYPAYRNAVMLAGATCQNYQMNPQTGIPDLSLLKQEDLAQVKILFLNYPHMPTGKTASRESFENLVTFARENNILLVHDNAYSFVLNPAPLSILSVEGARGVALELNSLSKSHNMAGWRVGMLCGDAERINEVLRFKSNMDSGMFLPIQVAAARALQLDASWYDEMNAVYNNRKKKGLELLEKVLQCSCDAEQAGLFLWAKVPSTYSDGYALCDQLLDQARVFVTPGGIFGSAGDRFIRLSLCSPASDFDEAIQRIISVQS